MEKYIEKTNIPFRLIIVHSVNIFKRVNKIKDDKTVIKISLKIKTDR